MHKSVSVILPLYNEEDNIEQLVSATLSFFAQGRGVFEIILVNDGSTDGTGAIVERLSTNNKYAQSVNHSANKGYGAALISGFGVARYEIIVLMDADGQFDVSEVEKFLNLSKDFDIVAGYRIRRQDPRYRVMMGKLYAQLISFLFGISLKDVNCGFKAIKKSVLDRLEIFSTGALIDAEILVKAKRIGCTIKEVGVNHFPRKRGRQTGANFSVIMKGIHELWNLFLEARLGRQKPR